MIFVLTVVLASFLGGMVSAGLVCSRRKRFGMLLLATTCAGTALIVVTTVATGGGSMEHARDLGTKYVFVPLGGAAIVFFVVLVGRVIRAIVRVVVKSISVFSSDVVTDIRRLVAKPTDQSQGSPREISASSQRALVYVIVFTMILFGLNAKTISDLASRLAPKLPTVTNLLDLISFVLVTPKLFTVDVRNNLLHAYIQTLQAYTFGKIQLPHNTLTYTIGAVLLLSTFSLFPLLLLDLSEINYSQLLEITAMYSQFAKSTKLFDGSFFDYIGSHLVESHSVFAAMWPFQASVMIVYVVFTISVILLSALARPTPEAQDRLADTLLRWGLVVFIYSRALSMVG